MDTVVNNINLGANQVPLAICLLQLSRIKPSATDVQKRRRARYDQTALKELADNIKVMQVIEPIIVRPTDASAESFEIVAGERRWLASKQAGLETVPAIVRTLDDSQVLEIQLVENLQREGLHELEEAEGYETLMTKHGYDIDGLLVKFGKRSRPYIYGRLKLLALDKKSREAFYQGKLNASTALLLARIPVPALQNKALKDITEGWNGAIMSVRAAAEHVQQHYMLRLKDAPFDQKQIDLVPAAGACGSCPKRTGNQPELFGDVKGADVCTDPECFAAKRSAWYVLIEARAKAEGRKVLAGEDAKRIAPYGVDSSLHGGYVKLDDTCYQDAKHRTYRQLLGKDFKAETLLQDPKSGQIVELAKLSDHAETLKAKGVRAEQGRSSGSDGERQRQKAAKLETTFRERVFNAVRTKTPGQLGGEDLRLVATVLWHQAGHDERVRLVTLWNWADKKKANDVVHQSAGQIGKLSEEQLRRFVLDCALIDEVRAHAYSTGKPTKLLDAAKRSRIDTDAIRKALKDEQKARATAKGSTKTTSAKPAVPKGKQRKTKVA
jgi:ParB/RepB/Spo0J family partition protein